MNWTTIAQIAGSGAVVGFLSTVFGWLTSRARQRAEVGQVAAQTGKVTAEGRVAESGSYLAWAQHADERAKRAEQRLDAAEDEGREARAAAEQSIRDLANLREVLDDLRRDHDSLVDRITTCRAGTSCPVAAAVIR